MSEGSAKKEERCRFQAIKGVRDILPPESALWNRVEQSAREVFATYGFGEIRLPIFEQTELFARSVGEHTDIVSKEMYTFLSNVEPGSSEQSVPTSSLSLRPEATASVVRAYIEHGMQMLPGNVKLYYVGPMFRRERPQKGRYRQFYQIGAEVLSHSGGLIEDARVDAEVIEMLMAFLAHVGLTQTTLHVNSIGHSAPECRRGYVARLRAELLNVKDQLGADSQRRIATNPLRVLDSKLPSEQETIAKLPHIADHLCEDCRKHYAELRAQLALRGIAYEENWRLVRGLDYYMRTTFEITAMGLGSQNAVCGGGRYDGLVELLGGPLTKGIGFAIGTDRLVLSVQETALQGARKVEAESGLAAYVAWMGDAAYPTAVRIAQVLRKAGLRVELPAGDAKLGKSLGLADKLGARYAVIVGENEVASAEFVVKRLADAEQKKVREGELVAAVSGK
ncbi:MAG TPA: histidine--tRNA ligase [Candidatus Dormibacteraeota bacterium]|nr:histidine--tRNA ligase [Candidatus Dormibacteraeota bacterium]